MRLAVRVQLSFMMFLEFFIWGAWFVTLGTFVLKNLQGTTDSQVGVAFLTQSIGAVIAPFIVGIIADRFIAAQIILGVIHLLGAALLWTCSGMTSFDTFYPLLLAYMILYMPTLALVNSISFRQMRDPSKEFSFIRVFGTAGWIIAGLLIGWLNWEKNSSLDLTFKMAAAASLLLGAFSFTLPKTPPSKKGTEISVREILGLDAIRMLKNRSYLLFFLSSIAICIPLAFYYNFTNPFLNEIGMNAAAGKQSMGQMSEFLFMLVMPLFFARLGVKKMLGLGMLAWVIRYTLFAYGNIDANYWMLIIGIVLHGICYDFFFVTGQIYTDKIAGEEFKSSAQGFVTLATYGVGMLIGFLISGPIVASYKTANGHNWQSIWLIPAGIAAVVLVLFMLFFRDSRQSK
ncbi:nucleoside permease [Chitinophaga polysaccharea]|uniref:nucleoside permease n=1 Tax=Chitinophaga TaxID=79328 RepID=UPI001454FAAF|nr:MULTISPECIES: nucleoside permease [Chitinophaga]NLR61932.1 nucleoside permease [Chitinophaga polysaccharea]NLU94481.1 nucleoside permease [Chitinophaga sp. Ak27]